MGNNHFELESFKLFSDSLIWQLNRDFYQQMGIDAWNTKIVPHHLTSNSMVGKTYAELILGFLKDLAVQGNINDTVYILELGAGHGRLSFHILKHLEELASLLNLKLPPYCYIISDIVEDNLLFLKNHPQLQTYFEQGILDLAYFDAIGSKEIHLQYANTTIKPKDLNQPIIAIANYFFDSIPCDLFLIEEEKIAVCSIALKSREQPKDVDTTRLIKGLELTYQKTPLVEEFYPDSISNEIIEEYKKSLLKTHLFFPHKSFDCLNNLIDFSNKGLLLLSMDKGFHEIHDLENRKEPDIIKHGSFSLWVNYHAFSRFCKKKGGKALFSSFSTFHLELGCLFFLSDEDSYQYTNAAYQRFVDNFGPDDFHTIKKLAYDILSKLNLIELIALIRLSSYDSIFFIKILPQLKKVSKRISFNQRTRIAETLHQVWRFYFNIHEPYDLAYELGGLFYDLGFYLDALKYFQYAINFFGPTEEIYYNQILCYYQLRKDDLFRNTLKEAKIFFPNSTVLKPLDKLDLNAE